MDRDELYMQRCFDLARIGAGKVSPNPMVGAVLVHNTRIIGEGYHQAYRQAHAEVNAIASVAKKDRPLIEASTLYVSLEPCCIHGNTPPCTSMIIREKIPEVIISALDQTPGVAGKGVQQLREAGIKVKIGVLSAQGKRLSAIRNTFVTKERPYVILKYAQTADCFFARSDGRPFWISNTFSKRLVHKWRSEVDAILITSRTAQLDNSRLTNRLYFGKSPQRIVIDRNLELPEDHPVFDQSTTTLIFHSSIKEPAHPKVELLPIPANRKLGPLLEHLHQRNISTLLVEGGARLLESFLDQELWDEARVFTGSTQLQHGIIAPTMPIPYSNRYKLDNDQLLIYYR